MNGFEVAALIMMEHPGISVVIMSGLPDNESTATEKGFLFVRKPFTATLLIDRVREALLRIPAQPETRTKSRQKAS